MTQKQLIDQFCEFRGKCTTDDVVALTYAYKSLQLDFVNKACEWIEENYPSLDGHRDWLIEQCRNCKFFKPRTDVSNFYYCEVRTWGKYNRHYCVKPHTKGCDKFERL